MRGLSISVAVGRIGATLLCLLGLPLAGEILTRVAPEQIRGVVGGGGTKLTVDQAIRFLRSGQLEKGVTFQMGPDGELLSIVAPGRNEPEGTERGDGSRSETMVWLMIP